MARKSVPLQAKDETMVRQGLAALDQNQKSVATNAQAVSTAALSALVFSNPPTQAQVEALRDAVVDVATALRSIHS